VGAREVARVWTSGVEGDGEAIGCRVEIRGRGDEDGASRGAATRLAGGKRRGRRAEPRGEGGGRPPYRLKE
jgi:hypothetical protein